MNNAYGLSAGVTGPLPYPTDGWRKLRKALRLLARKRFRHGLRHRVGAAIEHRHLAAVGARTVVDVGAHHGQFALLALELFPQAQIISFEPLAGPRSRLQAVVGEESRITVLPLALGRRSGRQLMHVAARDDCSSLLPPIAIDSDLFRRTRAVASELVTVARLDEVFGPANIRPPALLKIDVQGFEGEVLAGAGDLLAWFDAIYVEASFRELYGGQPLIHDLLPALSRHGFRLSGVDNVLYDASGQALQADFDFRRRLSRPLPATGERDRRAAPTPAPASRGRLAVVPDPT